MRSCARLLFKMMMIMSENTKLDEPGSNQEGEPNDQVPEWLAVQLRHWNEQVMQEKLPEDLLMLLKQIHNNERNR